MLMRKNEIDEQFNEIQDLLIYSVERNWFNKLTTKLILMNNCIFVFTFC